MTTEDGDRRLGTSDAGAAVLMPPLLEEEN